MSAGILIVDDEEGVRGVTKMLLAMHGYAVDTANDGAEAVDQAYEAGVDGYVVKPLDMKSLVQRVETTLMKEL